MCSCQGESNLISRRKSSQLCFPHWREKPGLRDRADKSDRSQAFRAGEEGGTGVELLHGPLPLMTYTGTAEKCKSGSSLLLFFPLLLLLGAKSPLALKANWTSTSTNVESQSAVIIAVLSVLVVLILELQMELSVASSQPNLCQCFLGRDETHRKDKSQITFL